MTVTGDDVFAIGGPTQYDDDVIVLGIANVNAGDLLFGRSFESGSQKK